MSSSGVISISNYIDGHFVPNKTTFASHSPSTGQVNALIPDSDGEAVEAAVAAAEKAFPM